MGPVGGRVRWTGSSWVARMWRQRQMQCRHPRRPTWLHLHLPSPPLPFRPHLQLFLLEQKARLTQSPWTGLLRAMAAVLAAATTITWMVPRHRTEMAAIVVPVRPPPGCEVSTRSTGATSSIAPRPPLATTGVGSAGGAESATATPSARALNGPPFVSADMARCTTERRTRNLCIYWQQYVYLCRAFWRRVRSAKALRQTSETVTDATRRCLPLPCFLFATICPPLRIPSL